VRRRDFITLLGGAAAAWPLAARGQQAADQMRRIGVLTVFSKDDPEGQRRVAALLQKLQELGWTDGRNVQIEFRWGGGDPDRSRFYAGELVGMKPDVILVNNAVVLPLLQNETHTYQSSCWGSPTRWQRGLLRASRGRAATSPGFPMPNMRSAAKSSKF
jgi:putative ABC transport system substrate-binding protein